MEYDYLSESYVSAQRERVLDVVEKIGSKIDIVSMGRVVPNQDELAIGTGRSLRAAVLFIDICRFSARPSGTISDQEVLLRALNLFFTEMIRVAEEYGGTVEKNTGDGLMAYFEDNAGDPKEQGCKRAVAAALTMMFVNQILLNPILSGWAVDPIEFRVGIDYGLVTIAQLGAARRFGGLVAIGATANIASKLLNHASSGEIVIGNDVFLNLPHIWQTHCARHEPTAFIYTRTNEQYWAYKFNGRWLRRA